MKRNLLISLLSLILVAVLAFQPLAAMGAPKEPVNTIATNDNQYRFEEKVPDIGGKEATFELYTSDGYILREKYGPDIYDKKLDRSAKLDGNTDYYIEISPQSYGSSDMFNVKGKWYYRRNNNIYSSNWEFKNTKTLVRTKTSTVIKNNPEFYENLGLYKDRLYYNERGFIYSVDLNGKDRRTLVNALDKKLKNPFVYEFNILEGTLYYSVKHSKGFKTFSVKL